MAYAFYAGIDKSWMCPDFQAIPRMTLHASKFHASNFRTKNTGLTMTWNANEGRKL